MGVVGLHGMAVSDMGAIIELVVVDYQFSADFKLLIFVPNSC